MDYSVEIDGELSTCRLTDEAVLLKNTNVEVTLNINDVIGCEEKDSSTSLWHIENGDGFKLTKTEVQLTGDKAVCSQLCRDLTDKLRKVAKRPKSLLVLINPIGGNGTGKQDYSDIVAPVFKLANITCDVIVSERSKQMTEVAKTYDLSKVDGIAIHGGDGSYHEVMNVLMRKRQEEAGINYNDPTVKLAPLEIPISMIPSGTGNGVAESNVGSKDILNAALHVIKGKTSRTSVLGVYADDKLQGYGGTTTTYGCMSDLLYYADRKFRWFGRLRYLIVPLWMFLVTGMRPFRGEMTFYTITSAVDESSADKEEESSKERTILAEGQKITGFKSFTENEVVFDGSFKLLMALNGNLLKSDGSLTFDVKNMYKRPRNVHTAFVWKESVTIMQILKFLRMAHSRDDVREEKSDSNFCMNIRGFRLKVENDGTSLDFSQMSEYERLKHIITIDGEIYEIKKLDIQERIHQDVITIYTSFFDDMEIKSVQ